MPRVSFEDVRRALAVRPAARVPDAVRYRAAVALILREAAEGLELLFIRRAEHPADPWSGQMAFPGGRAEPGDADLRATAVRETAEEIGVDLAEGGEHLGALDEVRALSRLRPMDLTIQPYVFRLGRPVTPVLSDEVLAVHWIGLEGLLDGRFGGTLEYVVDGRTLTLPCFRVDGGKVIWGLTYRMFANLQELLGAHDRLEQQV